MVGEPIVIFASDHLFSIMGGGPGLKPLEFTDCLTDSPYFREKLHTHEKELERTSQQIKGLVKEVKDLLNAARRKCFELFTCYL